MQSHEVFSLGSIVSSRVWTSRTPVFIVPVRAIAEQGAGSPCDRSQVFLKQSTNVMTPLSWMEGYLSMQDTDARDTETGALAEIDRGIAEAVDVVSALRLQTETIFAASAAIARSILKGGRVFTVGNGGSATHAQHMAAEFTGRLDKMRPALPALCLCDDSCMITAWANDHSFDTVYERLLEAHGKPRDVLIAFSTSGGTLNSGRSRSIGLAVASAKAHGLVTIGLAGCDGGVLGRLCDICLIVRSDNTARVQEAHGVILHTLVSTVERLLDTTPSGRA